MSETVNLGYVITGNSADAEDAFDRTGKASEDAGDRVKRSSDDIAGGYDKAGEAADQAETRAEGFAYILSGAADAGAGFGAIMRGDVFAGSVQAAMGIADLSQGIAKFALPALKALTVANAKSAVASARSAVAAGAHKAAMIAGAVVTGIMTAAQWALNVALTANPIGLVILAIVALVGILILAYKKSDTFRAIVQAAMRGVVAAFGWVVDKAKQLWTWIKGNWPLLLAILTGPIGLAVRWIAQHFDQLKTAVVSKWNAIVAFIRGIPSAIVRALGNLSRLLYNLGGQIVQGLANGIRDAARRAWSAATALAQGVKDRVKDALSIFSPSRVMEQYGEFTAQGFARGIERVTPEVSGVATAMAGAATASGAGAGSTAGGGGMHIHIHTPAVVTSERQLLSLIDTARARVGGAGTFVPKAAT